MQKTLIAIAVIFLISVIAGAVLIIVAGGGGLGRQTGSEISKSASKKTSETILISYDRGENWEKAGIPRVFGVKEIFLSKSRPGTIFVLTAKNGIWVKARDKNEWKELPSLKIKKNSLLYFLAEDKKNNLYVSFYSDRRGRVVKYNLENGKEEEIYHTPLEGYGVFGILVSGDGKIIRLISSDGGFYESRNGGYAWRVVKRFKEGLLGMVFDSFANNLWLVNSKGKILRTGAAGENWEVIKELEKFDKADEVENLFFDANSGFLYLASGHGLLRALYGKNWEVLPLLVPVEALPIKAVVVDPTDSSVIYSGSKNQFYKSEDSGRTWRTRTLPTTRQISRVAVDLIDRNTIYVGLE